MSQVHKSGYTTEHLSEVLTGIGYYNITNEKPKKTCCMPVIRLKATKI